MRKLILFALLFAFSVFALASCDSLLNPMGSLKLKEFKVVDKQIVANEDGSFDCTLKLTGGKTEKVYCEGFGSYNIGDFVRIYVER